jgi:AcrR family transcriptional regulator
VHSATQERSRLLRDKFVSACREMLLTIRLRDVSIPALAQGAESSVGGFYSRFESKEALFEYMRSLMLGDHEALFKANLDPATNRNETPLAICTVFIDTMLQVFGGPWRGVLREAYASIAESDSNWSPMRHRGKRLRETMSELLKPHIANTKASRDRLAFGLQMVFSCLNNELINPNLSYSITDDRFREYLIVSLYQIVVDAESSRR